MLYESPHIKPKPALPSTGNTQSQVATTKTASPLTKISRPAQRPVKSTPIPSINKGNVNSIIQKKHLGTPQTSVNGEAAKAAGMAKYNAAKAAGMAKYNAAKAAGMAKHDAAKTAAMAKNKAARDAAMAKRGTRPTKPAVDPATIAARKAAYLAKHKNKI